jgi:hypothetical protein
LFQSFSAAFKAHIKSELSFLLGHIVLLRVTPKAGMVCFEIRGRLLPKAGIFDSEI